MKGMKSLASDLKAMFSSPQTPASPKPSLDSRRIWIAISFVAVSALCGVLFGMLSNGASSNEVVAEQGASTASQIEDSKESGSLVIDFNSNRPVSDSSSVLRASSGTLVKVRLLNVLETFDTVPVFAQVSDYSLGESFYGWTLIGTASGDGNVERIKMTFQSARSRNGKKNLEFSGQALSLNGTLGVRADKVEGFVGRVATGASKLGSSSIANSFKGEDGLSSLLIRALVSGLENEISSDLGAAYNRGAALKLNPGYEFYVQLNEDF